MTNNPPQPEILERAVKRGHEPWVYLLAGLGAVGCVFLVVKLLDDPEVVVVSDDLSLSEFIWVQKSASWLGVDVALPRRGGHPVGGAGGGVVVSRVLRDSPAQAAGIHSRDLIVSVDGEAVAKPVELSRIVASHKGGDVVCLILERGGRQLVAHARLSAMPTARLAAATDAAGKAWIGIDLQPVDDLIARQLGLPDRRGVIVSYVHAGSPAAAAGLMQGDVIRRSGALRLESVAQLDAIVAGGRPGDALQLMLLRGGAPMDVRIVLANRPPPSAQRQPVLPEAEVEIEAAWLGLDISPLSAAEAAELGLADGTRGMVVEGVAPGPGVEAGFQVGDVIIAVNGRPTPSVTKFQEATDKAAGALVDAVRFGRHVYISVPAPNAAAVGKTKNTPVRQVALGSW
jgi:S1-C subfamily serine protease